MTERRITNDSDETIVLRPGDSIDIRGYQETTKSTVSRTYEWIIEETDRKSVDHEQ